jgi:hypothetical protein
MKKKYFNLKMNFNDVPLEDIKYLLSYYDQPLTNDVYLQAWNFILSNPNISVPKSIDDWIIAHNLQNRFKELPNEVVGKIISEFDYDEIKKLCGIDKRFNFICDEYVGPTIKRLITDELIHVKDINSTVQLINIYKTIKLNKRIICLDHNMYGDEMYAILRSDGQVLIRKISSQIDSDEDDSGDAQYEYTNCILGDNVISLSLNGKKFVTYTSNGDTYIYRNFKIVGTICDYSVKKIELMNIIQISGDQELYYLDSKGFVYNERYEIILKDIVLMSSNETSTIFLTKNGDIYGIGNNEHGVLGLGHTDKVNEPTKLSLENVKTVHVSKYITYALTNEDELYVFGYGKKPARGGIYKYRLPTLLDDAPNNIKKIIFSDTEIPHPNILTHDGSVYKMFNASRIITNHETEFLEPETAGNIVDISIYRGTSTLILNNEGLLSLLRGIENTKHDILQAPDIKLLDNALIKTNNNIFFIGMENDEFVLYNINS